MKKWITLSAMAMVMAFATVAISAQAAGGKQAPPTAKSDPKKEAPKKDEPAKKDDKKMASPCPAGEHLKDAKKPKDAKTNPCVKG